MQQDHCLTACEVKCTTCSGVVRRVTHVLCELRNEVVTFPTASAAVLEMQRDFFAISGFPQAPVAAVEYCCLDLL